MEKPFWKSKKFIYAVASFVAAVVLAVLPSVTTLDADTVTMLHDVVPKVVLGGFLLIAGHTVTDVVYLAVQARDVPLREAAHGLVDAVLPENEEAQAATGR